MKNTRHKVLLTNRQLDTIEEALQMLDLDYNHMMVIRGKDSYSAESKRVLRNIKSVRRTLDRVKA